MFVTILKFNKLKTFHTHTHLLYFFNFKEKSILLDILYNTFKIKFFNTLCFPSEKLIITSKDEILHLKKKDFVLISHHHTI